MEPPSGEGTDEYVVFLSTFPLTSHLISAGGLLLSVVHVKATLSPVFASVAPEMVT